MPVFRPLIRWKHDDGFLIVAADEGVLIAGPFETREEAECARYYIDQSATSELPGLDGG